MKNVKAISIPDPHPVAGYTKVEYVESAMSDCAIDLGFIPTANTKIELEFEWSDANYTGWCPLYGERGSTSATYFGGYLNNTSNYFSPNYAGFDPGVNAGLILARNIKYNIKTDSGNLYINDTLWSAASITNTLTTGTENFYLFGRGQSGSHYTQQIVAKIYYMMIYEGSTLIRHLVPVKNSSNVAGLYDLVNNVFYTPVSGNALTAGQDAQANVIKIEDANGNILWDGRYKYTYYTDEAHWLCVPKTGEYMNYVGTGVIFNNNKRMYIIQKFDNSGRIYWNKAWGSAESGGTACQLQNGSSSTGSVRFYLGGKTVDKTHTTSSSPTASQWKPNTKMYVTLDSNANTVRYAIGTYNNASTTTLTGTSYSGNVEIKLFGYNNSTSGNGWKIARVEIRDIASNVSVRQMWPCKRSDGVLGMYDSYTNTFFPISYTGSGTDGSSLFWIEDDSGNIV